tara:strand:- start:48 stop:815 length:768 start_codon:yes stop_codon:yes gene_type:complete
MSDLWSKKSYKKIRVLENDVNFFVPNELINWRVDTLFTKEPETLEWIDSFEKKDNIIFWDIGANIGLYSIYNAIKNENSITISFEPSTSNLRVLSRNISINNLDNKIKLFPLPLTNHENSFLPMHEKDFVEGGALNAFGKNLDFEGKEFKSEMKYNLFGTSINFLLKNQILEIPDYVKIDVDGLEHLILDGANEYLGNKKIKSLSIEINENFKDQFEKVIITMKKYGFKVFSKNQNKELSNSENFKKVFNYIFIR